MNQPTQSIAIVGMACIYPEARNPKELWENVMAQRSAFRRMPAERLRIEDYFSADRATPDATYATRAAVIEGYAFDRAAFQVVGTTYRAADLVHWLALDVASQALADAGCAEAQGLPRESTGVLIGNTLTGEMSRANALRLRWPYVRRVLDAALTKTGWDSGQCQQFLADLELDYKAPFPPIGEESLAGGLSNTIAGRICNHFDLKGGGYTVDGACASSLLAVANACSALVSGDLDAAIAGGVDLSLDPFEIIGFAKTGALALNEMRVFDQHSEGFLPGEGCGMVVLMRHEDAIAKGLRVYAVIQGWGISSDGKGGLTRPEVAGQLEALRRTYRRAGFGIETVAYCEGHGTGTAVGDAIELEVLSTARSQTQKAFAPAAIGSVKANIGHTKAAAGIAGLIKATMALHEQVLPPTTGCPEPDARIHECGDALRIVREPEPWPEGGALRASVSAMGFGGINCHVVVENLTSMRKSNLTERELMLARSPQDAELFLFKADSRYDLIGQLTGVRTLAWRISQSELGDLAAALEKKLTAGLFRAAVMASNPVELVARLDRLSELLKTGVERTLDAQNGVFFGSGTKEPLIGYLFPGQGSPLHLDGGLWKRRFESVRELYSGEIPTREAGIVSTKWMQPAVVRASLAGMRILHRLGFKANGAVGHSLGEITALHWGGAFGEAALLRIVRVRGETMAKLGDPAGAMLAVAAPWQRVEELIGDKPLAVVGYNSPRQTVVAGPVGSILKFVAVVEANGLVCSLLPVSHAFHTPLVAAAVPALAQCLRKETFSLLKANIFSTVNGSLLNYGEDLRELLCRQATQSVQFGHAFAQFERAKDLLIEVGPGAVLAGLAEETTDVPVVSLDAGGPSLKGLLQAVGAAFTLGSPLDTSALFEDRFTRPFSLDWNPKFFSNPCEQAPVSKADESRTMAGTESGQTKLIAPTLDSNSADSVRLVIARRTELPAASIADDSRMLSDLHLNSITVGQIVAEVARNRGISSITNLTDFANASVSEIAQAMVELESTAGIESVTDSGEFPAGVDNWTRCFATEWREAEASNSPLRQIKAENGTVEWTIFAHQQHPFAEQLREVLNRAERDSGVVVWIPRAPDEQVISQLLAAARTVVALKGKRKFVVVQHGWGGSGFAKTLHLENPDISICVVNVPENCGAAVDWIASEVARTNAISEVRFDTAGKRYVPRLKLLEPRLLETKPTWTLGPRDVLLVTGGGKGIAAECALAYALKTGVRLALVGRSDPQFDQELAANLRRFGESHVHFRYVSADITDRSSLQQAIASFQASLGEITGVLHAAGVNTPRLLDVLNKEAFRATVLPKIRGLENLLGAVNQNGLKLLVTFGSIIARTGLPGEADYATANEWLTALTSEFQEQCPRCHCLALEWSIWAGAGMGERLGRIETLARQGIQAIPNAVGAEIFCRLADEPCAVTSLVVAGRFGTPPTLQFDEPELPLRRFLENKRLFYPGVELIVDAELSVQSDPYLLDHVVQNQPMLPAVLGMEAMAQTALVLHGSTALPILEQVEFRRPVVASEAGKLRIRIAALRREDGSVEVCVRSSETDFLVDHYRAVCRFGGDSLVANLPSGISKTDAGLIPVDPQLDLYGALLFQGKRFQRLGGYRTLGAKECLVEILPDDPAKWFGQYFPGELVLGNPGARDAAIHAIQACIPHQRILPIGVDRLLIQRIDSGAKLAHARERQHEGKDFIYDVEITDLNGGLLERHEGLRLRAVETISWGQAMPPVLIANYLERYLEDFAPTSKIHLAIAQHSRTRGQLATDALIQMAMGRKRRIWRTAQGRPMCAGGEYVSASHSRGHSLAVSAKSEISCDLEEISDRSASDWMDLLCADRFRLAERIQEDDGGTFNTAATRAWTAIECLKKLGHGADTSLLLEACRAGGWVLLRFGPTIVHTCLVSIKGELSPFVVAVAVNNNNLRQSSRAQGATVANFGG